MTLPADDALLAAVAGVVEHGEAIGAFSVMDLQWLGQQMPAVLARLEQERHPQLALQEPIR